MLFGIASILLAIFSTYLQNYRFYTLLISRESILADNVEFGESGFYFFYFFLICNVFFYLILKNSRHQSIISGLLMIQFAILSIQLILPDTFYVVKYRFILFSYLFSSLCFCVGGYHALKQKGLSSTLGVAFLLIINIFILYRFATQLSDNFIYNIDFLDLIINIY
jgi:hypothetical protein